MSAIDELRRMLDERGVEHHDHYLSTSWIAGGILYMASDLLDGTLAVDNLTPEQAIAVCNTRAERTCRNISDEYNEKEIGATSFCCSECGAHYEDAESYYAFLASDDDITHWCPSCGAKVVDK